MAKLRKACAYRRIERAYTRVSKYREKSYVRARPHMVITKFDTGDTKRQFEDYRYNLNLVSTKDIQVRHNAMEAARMASSRILEAELGKNGFHMRIKLYPHHIIRENAMAAGAGADRMSQGMSLSFGKPIGSAAQVRKGQSLVITGVDTLAQVNVAKRALKNGSTKFPCKFRIVVTELKK